MRAYCGHPEVELALVKLYSVTGEERYLNLSLSVTLQQKSELPWNGCVEFNVSIPEGNSGARFVLALRIPNWFQSGRPTLRVNGKLQEYREEKGYASLNRTWSDGDTAEWLLPIETKLIAANPLIRADAGKAAIQRGPLVYCVEEADNGKPLTSLSLASEPNLTERGVSDLLGGCVVVEGDGLVTDSGDWREDQLYRPLEKKNKTVRFKAIPYYLWGNRVPGEMIVWLRI